MHSPVENLERKMSLRRVGSFYQAITSATTENVAKKVAKKPTIGRTAFPPHSLASDQHPVSSQTLENNQKRFVRRSYKCLPQPKMLMDGTEASALLPTPPQSPGTPP